MMNPYKWLMKKMYTQWLKVFATNRTLGGQNQELRNLKNKAEGKVPQFEALVAGKKKKRKRNSSLLQ